MSRSISPFSLVAFLNLVLPFFGSFFIENIPIAFAGLGFIYCWIYFNQHTNNGSNY